MTRSRRRDRGAARGKRRPDSPPAPAAGPQRIQKLIAQAGIASRRGAEGFLLEGRVEVNGKPAQLGDRADPGVDDIRLDGEPLAPLSLRYWAVHKPRGMLTTLHDPEGRPTIVELLPPGLPRLFPVGRLDGDTSGLVLLTNDGPLAHRLLHPSLGNPREYRITVQGPIEPSKLEKLAAGVRLEDGWTAPARVGAPRYDARRDATSFRLVLREGRKRQIRRALIALGHPVKRLVRTALGPLQLGDLAAGAARELARDELDRLREHVASLEPTPRPPRSRRRA